MKKFQISLTVAAIAVSFGASSKAIARPFERNSDPIIPLFVRDIEKTVVDDAAIKEFLKIRENLKDSKKEDKGRAHFEAAVNRAVEAGKKAVAESGIAITSYKMYPDDTSEISIEQRKKLIDQDLKEQAQYILLKNFYWEDEKKIKVPSYVEMNGGLFGPGTINHPTCKVYMPRQGFQDGAGILQARLLEKGYNIKIVGYDDPVETFESPKKDGLVMYTKNYTIPSPIADEGGSCRAEVYLGAGKGTTIKKITSRNFTWLTKKNYADCETLYHNTISSIPACHATKPGLRELEYSGATGPRVKHPENKERPMYDPNDPDDAGSENTDAKPVVAQPVGGSDSEIKGSLNAGE